MKLLIFVIIIAFRIDNCKAQDLKLCDSRAFKVLLPLHHLRQTSAFGWRVHPITGRFQYHKGVDLAAHDDTVYNVMAGVIAKIGNNPSIGNYIIINHPRDLQTIYGHLSAISVLPNEPVRTGQPIAITGATGRVTGEHLHFSIKYQGQEISPMAFLCGLNAMPP